MGNEILAGCPLRCQVITIDLLGKGFVHQGARAVETLLQVSRIVIVHRLLHNTMAEEHTAFLGDEFVLEEFSNHNIEFRRDGDDVRKGLRFHFGVVKILLAKFKSSIQGPLVLWQEKVNQDTI